VHDVTELRLALFTDTYSPQVNNVARTLPLLVEAVRHRGGHVRVYTTSDPAATVATSDVHRYTSAPVPLNGDLRFALPQKARVLQDLHDFAPTLVHAATPFGMGLVARQVARELSVPFVTSYHTALSDYASSYHVGWLSRLGQQYLRWFHNSGIRTYCPTMAMQRELTMHDFTHLAVWGRGVDGNCFAPAKRSRAMRMRMGGSDDAMLIAYVGRIAKEKGIDHLVDAARQLAFDSHYRFAIAGDGPGLDDYRAVAPESVHFMGRLEGDDLAAFYASADAFIFSSATDTFGNVLLEAMASGVPILAADASPSREIVGGAAYYYASNRDTALAEAILGITSDRDVSRQLAVAGLSRSRHFRWDAVFDALIGDYRRIVNAHEPVRVDRGQMAVAPPLADYEERAVM
jgi:glycosyltransferase involved in cell wall biosynthesis